MTPEALKFLQDVLNEKPVPHEPIGLEQSQVVADVKFVLRFRLKFDLPSEVGSDWASQRACFELYAEEFLTRSMQELGSTS
jgi:hypothetical protein